MRFYRAAPPSLSWPTCTKGRPSPRSPPDSTSGASGHHPPATDRGCVGAGHRVLLPYKARKKAAVAEGGQLGARQAPRSRRPKPGPERRPQVRQPVARAARPARRPDGWAPGQAAVVARAQRRRRVRVVVARTVVNRTITVVRSVGPRRLAKRSRVLGGRWGGIQAAGVGVGVGVGVGRGRGRFGVEGAWGSGGRAFCGGLGNLGGAGGGGGAGGVGGGGGMGTAGGGGGAGGRGPAASAAGGSRAMRAGVMARPVVRARTAITRPRRDRRRVSRRDRRVGRRLR
ncbi:hypothetical protein HNP84_000093 [Thermocatellispora tengchongensis]|uniref:Uncharacterized protein n=1 Tax=Thermocatellispora tengchongensis TaxID=1073253 RepID=A0A840P2Z1_9ACTN|nr:hypothetical protein [Thermocatellispora tengchongensis]